MNHGLDTDEQVCFYEPWILCKDPNGSEVKPIYVEPRVVVSPFRIERESSGKAEKP